MKLTLDLHVHSDASFDGRMSVRQIALLAKARDVNDNKLRIDGPKNLVSDPLACPGTTLRCLEENIRILDHLEEDFLTLFREVVKSNGTLITTLSLLDVSSVADGVACARVLEPSNVSTPVSHEVTCLGASEFYCCVNDLNAVECTE